ncbi:MAG: hypothetical protein ACPGXK_05050 [Phycisphaerae bacterium]
MGFFVQGILTFIFLLSIGPCVADIPTGLDFFEMQQQLDMPQGLVHCTAGSEVRQADPLERPDPALYRDNYVAAANQTRGLAGKFQRPVMRL